MRKKQRGPLILRLKKGRLKALETRAAARILRNGGLVLFPTDTVYGLGVNALSPEARNKVYSIKHRDPSKPLPVLVESFTAASRLACFGSRARALARAFWPGPLTLVLNTTAAGRRAARGARTLGLRVPGQPALRRLLREARVPMAATSANRSGRPECRETREAIEEFGPFLDLVLDDGPRHGKPSSVVDLTGEEPILLRAGTLPWRVIKAALKKLPAISGRLKQQQNKR